MKRILSALLVCMLLASAVCAAYAEPVTFWTFQAAHRKFMESAAERWNETYPDRPLELQAETLGYDDLHNNLLISLQTGTGAPDIVDIEIAMYANFITGDEQYIPLLPLNDIIEPEKDHFIMGRFDNYANHGNYYGVDYHVGAIAMPLWYLNRFTDYMPDLKGKMAVRTMPVWSEGARTPAASAAPAPPSPTRPRTRSCARISCTSPSSPTRARSRPGRSWASIRCATTCTTIRR